MLHGHNLGATDKNQASLRDLSVGNARRPWKHSTLAASFTKEELMAWVKRNWYVLLLFHVIYLTMCALVWAVTGWPNSITDFGVVIGGLAAFWWYARGTLLR
jgi:hypothetical protein